LNSYGQDRLSRYALNRSENGYFWSPAEADCMLDENSWFFRNRRKIKPLDVLMGIYYLSVGRGINLLLNIAPDKIGLLPEPDRSRLIEFGNHIRKRFSAPIAGISEFVRKRNRYKLTLDKPEKINHVILKEDITKGHKIRSFRIYGQPYIPSKNPVDLYTGTAVGHKAICRFPTVYFKELTVEIQKHDGPYSLKAIDVYKPD
jgi:alpha-L-fucosidase